MISVKSDTQAAVPTAAPTQSSDVKNAAADLLGIKGDSSAVPAKANSVSKPEHKGDPSVILEDKLPAAHKGEAKAEVKGESKSKV